MARRLLFVEGGATVVDGAPRRIEAERQRQKPDHVRRPAKDQRRTPDRLRHGRDIADEGNRRREQRRVRQRHKGVAGRLVLHMGGIERLPLVLDILGRAFGHPRSIHE